MVQNSKIEWTDHTFNLVIGCAKVSPGCASCYAETMNTRRGWAEWGKDGIRKVMSESYWKEPLKWNRKATELGQRQRVFCSSLADVFEDHPTVNEQRLRLWELIKQTPALDWQLLTKRPENFKKFLPADWENGYPNVMLGVSVEKFKQALIRIPELISTPATKRFLSCEPLLADIDLAPILFFHIEGGLNWVKPSEFRMDTELEYPFEYLKLLFRVQMWKLRGGDSNLSSNKLSDFIHWVIVGGESGTRARLCQINWIRNIVEDCKDLGIPVFVKQLGATTFSYSEEDYLYLTTPHDSKFSTFEAFPPDLQIRQVVYCQEQTKVTYAIECKSDEAETIVI